jgi:hypothetical protein
MSEEAVVETIADSSQAAEPSDSGFDVESVSNDLAADLFPTHESGEQPEHESESPELSAEPEQQEAQTEPEQTTAPPPKTWPKEMHDHWSKTPKEVQDYWNTREKQMLDGLEQYKGDAGFARQIKETLNPYMATINALGVDAPTAIRSLLNADHQLRVGSPSQKAQYFQHLAKQYGVDLGGIGQQQDGQQAVDPRLQQLQDELHGLKQVIQTGNQQQLDEQRQKIQNEVNSFASDPKHPYFDEVSDEIVALLKNGATLEDAYEKAVWANPVTRQKEMSRVQTEQQAALKAKAIAEAEAKKKAASVNLRNRDSQRTPTGPRATMSGLDSALRETMREIKSRH